LAVGEFDSRQLEQMTTLGCIDAPQLRQKRALGLFSALHAGHSTLGGTPTILGGGITGF